MWIRSQDKEKLLNICTFSIQDFEDNFQQRKYGILVQTYGEDFERAGVYSTKEKALKVLTDIQDEIEINNSLMPSVIEGKREKIYKVFQMPQDNEVK